MLAISASGCGCLNGERSQSLYQLLESHSVLANNGTSSDQYCCPVMKTDVLGFYIKVMLGNDLQVEEKIPAGGLKA